MSLHTNIILPSKPRVIKEEGNKGTYEIDNLYPGYGHTLGNSLRRIILSSLPGCAITSVSIDGVSHEFSTLEGVKEDVITILLNLKRIRFQMVGDEPQKITLSVKGPKVVTAKDISTTGQVDILNKEQPIAEITKKDFVLNITITVERGLGYVAKEEHKKDKVEIGAISVDANFTPIRRASYEVENMRVGDKTDHNRLRLVIETDGTLTPRLALEKSVQTMIDQLQAVVGFATAEDYAQSEPTSFKTEEDSSETSKIKVEDLDLSTRTLNALVSAGIKTVGGITRKKEEDILALEGLGEKGVQEIKKAIEEHGVSFK
jgi:DNA-directed RNA polymerase subunit alpha